MTSAKFDERVVRSGIMDLAYDLRTKGFRQAVNAGDKIVARTYIRVLSRSLVKPGSRNAQIASQSVEVKRGTFKSGDGVYSVIGTETLRGHSAAPQTLWGEHGTVKRKTRSGQNRGTMPALHWLAEAVAISAADAQDAMVKKLTSYAAKYRK